MNNFRSGVEAEPQRLGHVLEIFFVNVVTQLRSWVLNTKLELLQQF